MICIMLKTFRNKPRTWLSGVIPPIVPLALAAAATVGIESLLRDRDGQVVSLPPRVVGCALIPCQIRSSIILKNPIFLRLLNELRGQGNASSYSAQMQLKDYAS